MVILCTVHSTTYSKNIIYSAAVEKPGSRSKYRDEATTAMHIQKICAESFADDSTVKNSFLHMIEQKIRPFILRKLMLSEILYCK